MKGLIKELYQNSLFLYFNYLPHYGVDRHHTKKDILLLHCLNDLLDNNCYYELIDEKLMGQINRFYHYILNKNPQLKYCKIDLFSNYNNLGDAQFIEKYQIPSVNKESVEESDDNDDEKTDRPTDRPEYM